MTVKLTPREADVVRLIVQGRSNKEIARQLRLTQGTIKQYLAWIFEKVHVKNRTQLAMWAVTSALVRTDPPLLFKK